MSLRAVVLSVCLSCVPAGSSSRDAGSLSPDVVQLDAGPASRPAIPPTYQDLEPGKRLVALGDVHGDLDL